MKLLIDWSQRHQKSQKMFRSVGALGIEAMFELSLCSVVSLVLKRLRFLLLLAAALLYSLGAPRTSGFGLPTFLGYGCGVLGRYKP